MTEGDHRAIEIIDGGGKGQSSGFAAGSCDAGLASRPVLSTPPGGDADMGMGSQSLWAVLNAIPHPVAWKGRDLRYRGCNEAFARFMGVSAASVPGRTDAELGFEAVGPNAERELSVLRTGNGILDAEQDVTGCDGEPARILISTVPLVGPRGEIDGVVCTFTDITTLHRNESLLAQAWRLESLGRLAAGIAHEINTPMQYIGDNVGFVGKANTRLLHLVETAATQIGPGSAAPDERFCAELHDSRVEYIRDRAPRAVTRAAEGVQTVARIVSAMKDFSHPGLEEKIPTDLRAAIDHTLTVSRNEWKYVATVSVEVHPSVPFIPLVPGEFNQVLLNLIVNAAHAIADRFGPEAPAEAGSIRITVEPVGAESVRVDIADNGCGMAESMLSQIFEPFFTTKAIGRGTGQGLALAHQVIVTRHGGELLVSSQPGKGSVFTILVPRFDPLASTGGSP